jgi:hypothetical protein
MGRLIGNRRRFIALLLCVWAGCGKGGLATYPVEGTVKFRDGKPLFGGSVEFQPVGEQKGKISSRGYISPEGTFRMGTFKPGDGAIEGKHRVLVISPLPPGALDPTKPPKPFIHPRFQSYDTSGLEFTVSPTGPNKLDIPVDPP